MTAHLELALARQPEKASIPIELVWRQPNVGAAFSLACQSSGLEDKEIYLALGIDAGTFSRIKKAEANLPGDKISEFCRIVGNMVYPEWIAYQVGCTLAMLKSEAERRAEEAEQKLHEAEKQVELLTKVLQGKGQ